MATAKRTYEIAKPAITKAKELDIRLTEQQNALLQYQQQYNTKKSVLQTKETELEKVVEHIQKGESYIQTEEQWLNTHPDEAQLYRNALWLEQLTTDQQLLNEKLTAYKQTEERLTQQLSNLKAQYAIENLPSTDIEALAKQQKDYLTALQMYQSDREVAKRMMQYETQKIQGASLTGVATYTKSNRRGYNTIANSSGRS